MDSEAILAESGLLSAIITDNLNDLLTKIYFPDILTKGQAADYLQVSPRHIDKMALEQGLPRFKLNTSVRFDRDKIREWANSQSNQGVLPDE